MMNSLLTTFAWPALPLMDVTPTPSLHVTALIVGGYSIVAFAGIALRRHFNW